MKNILRSGAVLAMVLGLSGCGGKAGEAIGEMKKVKTAMCACKDAECVAKVSKDMESMTKKHANTKATESQVKEAMKIMGEITECAQKAAAGGAAAPAGG
ncbi:MAG: hypothetical protein IPL61_16080 [Myxococcales bacterium]|nr:hypothetical protein [Myxococcales bacterium]